MLSTEDYHVLFGWAQAQLQEPMNAELLVQQLSVEGTKDKQISFDFHNKLTKFRHLGAKTRLIKANKYIVWRKRVDHG